MNVAGLLSSERCSECSKRGAAVRIIIGVSPRVDLCLKCFLAMKSQVDLLSEGLELAPRPPRLELAHLRDLVERFAETDFVSVTELNAATLEWAIFNKVARVVGARVGLTPKGIYLLGREANS